VIVVVTVPPIAGQKNEIPKLNALHAVPPPDTVRETARPALFVPVQGPSYGVARRAQSVPVRAKDADSKKIRFRFDKDATPHLLKLMIFPFVGRILIE
jgi:hypothetical protein